MEVLRSPSMETSSSLFSQELSLKSLDINAIPPNNLNSSTSNTIPPFPKSSSAKFPLELSVKHQPCNLRIELDRSIYNNGETINGKVLLNFTQKQFLKRIKVQVCGYERIFLYAQEHSSNTYQTIKFYTDTLNVFPPVNICQDLNNVLTLNDNYHVELDCGNYEYQFSIALPKYLQPSMNYIGYLSIFYMIHCQVDYSRGREWKENKLIESTEFGLCGLSQRFLESLYQKSAQTLISSKISQFLWKNKSKPIEMAVCLKDYNCFIGEYSTFFIKIKNPMLLKLDHIRIDFVQTIEFIHPTNSNSSKHYKKYGNQTSFTSFSNFQTLTRDNNGEVTSKNPNKKRVSEITILSENFMDVHSFVPQNPENPYEIQFMQAHVLIPRFNGDDQVFPNTKGYLSQIKHYFLISIPSVSSDFKIRLSLKLWDKSIKNQSLSNSRSSEYLNNINNNNNNVNRNLSKSQQEMMIKEEWKINWLPKWKDDTTVSNCELCDDAFSIINRMHHCRSCGGIFCESCSSNKVSLKHFGITKKVRICLMCLESMNLDKQNAYLPGPKAFNHSTSMLKLSTQLPFLVEK
ncbi:FYVE-type zinc finger-containing protein [Tieghemostelium lacteum]|uniref:FYVE-type zinc finger-containing protein n=1 Tax=Tieghemostelium lacteum TaxID=361077 RepID=A0A152A6X1_TIELA|nr:FYVE-type zinc finger-containing protein [Tieghemostelium lacteum]|eukprot:KYR01978.1 FYVE-type zinc finger-containing protein [Tieghemostelium lacteum]